MAIFMKEDKVDLLRITQCVNLDAGLIESWPVVRTWETERGELAGIEEHETVRLLIGDRWEVKPRYVLSLIEDTYGPCNQLVGIKAMAYLAHRFKPE